MSRPTNETVAGRGPLALRGKARMAGRPMGEYLRIYALEGFLPRLSLPAHRDRLVLS